MVYTTREAAQRSRDCRVWPGCKGDGLCRPCGNVHDMGRNTTTEKGIEWRADFVCLENAVRGCPRPHPEATHDLNRLGNCRTCGAHVARESRPVAEADRV